MWCCSYSGGIENPGDESYKDYSPWIFNEAYNVHTRRSGEREKVLYYITMIVPEPLLSQKPSSLPFLSYPENPRSMQSIIYYERKKMKGELNIL